MKVMDHAHLFSHKSMVSDFAFVLCGSASLREKSRDQRSSFTQRRQGAKLRKAELEHYSQITRTDNISI